MNTQRSDIIHANQLTAGPLTHSLSSPSPKATPNPVAQRRSAMPCDRFSTKNIEKGQPEPIPTLQMYPKLVPRTVASPTRKAQLERSVKQLSSVISSVGSSSSLPHSPEIQTVQKHGWMNRPRLGAKSGLLSMRVFQMQFGSQSPWESCWLGCNICMIPLSVCHCLLEFLFTFLDQKAYFLHDTYFKKDNERS